MILSIFQSNNSFIFLDVGQGDASLIISKNKDAVLIDGGPNEDIIFAIGEYLSYSEIKIQLILVTHLHEDHYKGVEFMKRRNPELMVKFGMDIESIPDWCNTNCFILDSNISEYTLSEEILLTFISTPSKLSNINNNSVITFLKSSQINILYMGDAEIQEEKWLLENYENIIKDVSILKAGHHCSKTSSSDEFIKHIKPQKVICSLGENNKFGHPSNETLDRFNKYNIEVHRTDEQGSLIINR